MRKIISSAGLVVISASVFGMMPNDQEENSKNNNHKRHFSQISDNTTDNQQSRRTRHLSPDEQAFIYFLQHVQQESQRSDLSANPERAGQFSFFQNTQIYSQFYRPVNPTRTGQFFFFQNTRIYPQFYRHVNLTRTGQFFFFQNTHIYPQFYRHVNSTRTGQFFFSQNPMFTNMLVNATYLNRRQYLIYQILNNKEELLNCIHNYPLSAIIASLMLYSDRNIYQFQQRYPEFAAFIRSEVKSLNTKNMDYLMLGGKFANLTTLAISSDNLLSIPIESLSCPKLTELKINGKFRENQINQLNILDQLISKISPTLQKIDLNDTNLKICPNSVIHCKNLIYLALSENIYIGHLVTITKNLKEVFRPK